MEGFQYAKQQRKGQAQQGQGQQGQGQEQPRKDRLHKEDKGHGRQEKQQEGEAGQGQEGKGQKRQRQEQAKAQQPEQGQQSGDGAGAAKRQKDAAGGMRQQAQQQAQQRKGSKGPGGRPVAPQEMDSEARLQARLASYGKLTSKKVGASQRWGAGALGRWDAGALGLGQLAPADLGVWAAPGPGRPAPLSCCGRARLRRRQRLAPLAHLFWCSRAEEPGAALLLCGTCR
jgi:hypothetical protein